MKSRGNLFVISGPSGVGKGTICRQLINRNDNILVSVSATTRSPRTEDKEGVTYYFKTAEQFEVMIDNDEFLEWAVYNGNYYGTPIKPVEEKLEDGFDVILEIEVQGALKVMEKRPDCVSVFIAPPDDNALYERLKGRGSEAPEEIEKRVQASKWELQQRGKYEYIVVNDDLSQAVLEIEEIMKNKRK